LLTTNRTETGLPDCQRLNAEKLLIYNNHRHCCLAFNYWTPGRVWSRCGLGAWYALNVERRVLERGKKVLNFELNKFAASFSLLFSDFHCHPHRSHEGYCRNETLLLNGMLNRTFRLCAQSSMTELQKAEVYFGDVNRIQIQVRFMNVSLAVE
jgi:ATP-dependent helicase YprA (DUF1998 family)